MLKLNALLLDEGLVSSQGGLQLEHLLPQSGVVLFERGVARNKQLSLMADTAQLLGEILCHFIPNFYKSMKKFSTQQNYFFTLANFIL